MSLKNRLFKNKDSIFALVIAFLEIMLWLIWINQLRANLNIDLALIQLFALSWAMIMTASSIFALAIPKKKDWLLISIAVLLYVLAITTDAILVSAFPQNNFTIANIIAGVSVSLLFPRMLIEEERQDIDRERLVAQYIALLPEDERKPIVKKILKKLGIV